MTAISGRLGRTAARGVTVAAALLAVSCSPSTTLDTASSGPSATGSPTATEGGAAPTASRVTAPVTSMTRPTVPPVPTNPLTGLPQGGALPVLVVKLDNTRNAQPHAGLHRADVVYLEEVEYGMTRIAAVFADRVPQRIGPVRSARITDVDLLAQYQRPAFAFSGAQRRMLPVLAAAPFFDVSPGTGTQGYGRDGSRRAPYDYFLDGRIALERAPRATPARAIGFVFDVDVPAGGLVARRAEMSWISSSAAFRYSYRTGQYEISLNGERAQAEEHDRGQNAATVVIQYVKQTRSAYSDRYGGNTPHAQTIGSGRAIVLRDGLAWPARWSRPSAVEGTQFTLTDGRPMAFKPGQTWVVLLDRERSASVRPLSEPPSPGSPSGSPDAQ